MQHLDMQSQRYKENRNATFERRQEQSSTTVCRKMLISWPSEFGFPCFLYHIKAKEERCIQRLEDLNSYMQIKRFKENCKAVFERKQEQSSATVCTKMLISWPSEFGFQCFLYHIKAMEARCILKLEDLNSNMQSQRFRENCNAIFERRKEQSSAMLCRKMLISWSSKFRFQCFLYQIKAKEASFILTLEDLYSDMQSQRYKENHNAV